MSQDGSAAANLAAGLLADGAVPVPGRVTMYELSGDESREARTRLLTLVRRFEGVSYLLPSDDPTQRGGEFNWVHSEAGTWIVPVDASSEALLSGALQPGAWRVYVAAQPAPAEDAPDLFRGPGIAALDFLERYGVSVVLDAWHDNSRWRVAFIP